MKSVISHNFVQIPQANIQRSIFNRSFGHKTTFDAGYLIPIFWDFALPGDTFRVNGQMFARLASPLSYPIMDNMYMDCFFFAVPCRLLWSNWEKMMGQVEPDDTTEYLIPQIAAPAITGWTASSLQDYLGLPTGVASLASSALYTRAYNLIYNSWFRDENIIDSVPVDMDNGPDTASDYVLLKRGKRHDYFTSALPWPQKDFGAPVTLPLGTEAPVLGIGAYNQTFTAGSVDVYESGGSGTVNYATSKQLNSGLAQNQFHVQQDGTTGYPNIRVDLSEAASATINQLREAFQIQKLYERFARGGSRYTEIIRSCFGVVSPDQRLQRPEYLGGSTAPWRVTSVPNTSSTATEKQANLAAFGTLNSNCSWSKSFTEHCVLLGLVSCRADLTYQYGLNRMMSARTKFDIYWPALCNLGEQAVLTKEIFCDNTANDSIVFGYQERWAEYRMKPSMITAAMRSNHATSLDVWHLSQEFATYPTLSQLFIEETPPMARVKAVTTAPDFIFDSYFDMRCARPMPTYSVPGLIDHF